MRNSFICATTNRNQISLKYFGGFSHKVLLCIKSRCIMGLHSSQGDSELAYFPGISFPICFSPESTNVQASCTFKFFKRRTSLKKKVIFKYYLHLELGLPLVQSDYLYSALSNSMFNFSQTDLFSPVWNYPWNQLIGLPSRYSLWLTEVYLANCGIESRFVEHKSRDNFRTPLYEPSPTALQFVSEWKKLPAEIDSNKIKRKIQSNLGF